MTKHWVANRLQYSTDVYPTMFSTKNWASSQSGKLRPTRTRQSSYKNKLTKCERQRKTTSCCLTSNTKNILPQSVGSSARSKRLLLHPQPESRQPVYKVCVPRLHLDRTVYCDKKLSNNNYTIQRLGTRYTQTYTLRTNEYLPDPNVKVSHNEWYAVSWEMDFGKQIDEHEVTRSAENNQQIVTQEVVNTDDDTITPQISDNQNEDTHDVAPPSRDFSNLNTDVGDNPYIRRPPPPTH